MNITKESITTTMGSAVDATNDYFHIAAVLYNAPTIVATATPAITTTTTKKVTI